eukprot:1156736-Pelagomonas_calceolata.AAC.2
MRGPSQTEVNVERLELMLKRDRGPCNCKRQALIFSSMHVSGEQLKQLSGIAALLRFPLPDLEDQELNDEV